jgi:cell wall-associated NlpC family hydrolase
MTVADVTSRISQLQSQFALLAPSTSAGSTSFASTLTSATAAGADPSAVLDAATGSGAGLGALGGALGGSTSDAGGAAVVADAKKYLGIPYVWGGTNPKTGLDCSGLVQLVYKDMGISLPRVSYQQATAGRAVDGLANAKPGDILAFNSPVSHVAIYIGNNKMIEAPRPGTTVRISDVYKTPAAIRRVLPDTAVGTNARIGGATSSLPATTPYASLFSAASAKYGVDASLLAAVAKQESGYNAKAVSPAGAQGLMQLMPGTAKGLGVTNSFDPTQAVDGAAKLLHGLLREFGNTGLALAAYNAGAGAVHRYNGIPPYPETQNYVRSVLSTQMILAA